MNVPAGVVLALLVASIGSAQAEPTFEFSGFAAGELRLFPLEPIQEGQSNVRVAPSAVLEPELLWNWNAGRDRFVFVPNIRREILEYDIERNRVDIRELNWSHRGEDWFLVTGLAKVFWGKVESRRLVDIINQRDFAANVDRDDKLGQPLLNFGVNRTWGTTELYLMPYFREGTFPGRQGRLRGPFPVDTKEARYESDLKEFHPDIAVRYTRTLDIWDIGASYFHGTGREPRVTLDTDTHERLVLIPNYDIIDEVSTDIQATSGSWLWKLEALYRTGNDDPFIAATGGFEYTFFGIGGTSSDIGVLMEYTYDGRSERAPPTIFDDELYLGVRWVANDEADTDLLAGLLTDVKTGSQTYTARYRTRLTDNLSLKIEATAFNNVSEREDVLFAARKDHNMLIQLAYYF